MEQQAFPFPAPTGSPRLWILAAEPGTARDVARLLRFPCFVVDAENTSKAIRPGDAVLLARGAVPHWQLYLPAGSVAGGLLEGPERLRRALTDGATTFATRSTEVLVISSASSAREAGITCGESTDLERFMSRIAAPAVLRSPERRSALCRTFQGRVPEDCDPDLRSLVRVEAGRHPARGEPLGLLAEGLSSLRSAALEDLLVEALRRDGGGSDRRQLVLPWCPPARESRTGPRLGYTVRRATAISVDLPDGAAWSPSGRSPSFRELAWSAPVPTDELAGALSGVRSRLLDVRLSGPRYLSSAGGAVRVTMDWEMRSRLGVGGRGIPGPERFDVDVDPVGCSVAPTSAELGAGGCLDVTVIPTGQRPCEIEVTVYDRRGAAMRRRLAFRRRNGIIVSRPLVAWPGHPPNR